MTDQYWHHMFVSWQLQKRFKTVDRIVSIRMAIAELDICVQVKRAGIIWQRNRRVWDLRYGQVVVLGLEGRIVTEEGI